MSTTNVGPPARTAPTDPPATTRGPRGLRGPVWVTVRQHRTTWRIALAALVLGALALVAYRFWYEGVSDDFLATGCPDTPTDRACFQLARDFSDATTSFHAALRYGALAIQLLPGVIGVFVAGPLVARELESGTYKLSWTQSISPTRWLASKLLPVAVTVSAVAAVATAVYAWVWSLDTRDDLLTNPTWFETSTFMSLGTLPVAYALLGVAAGALAGLLVGRTLPAMSVGALAMGLVFIALTRVRTHLWPPDVATHPTEPRVPGGDTQYVAQGIVTADGERREGIPCLPDFPEDASCLSLDGARGIYFEYHPASHFWPLQLVETGIVLVLAAACVFGAFKVLGRRHG